MATKIEKAMAKLYKAASIIPEERPYIHINLLQREPNVRYDYHIAIVWFNDHTDIHPCSIRVEYEPTLEGAVDKVLAKLKEVNLERPKV